MSPSDSPRSRAVSILVAVLIPSGVVALLYWALILGRLDRSVAMFIGIPVVLGWLISLLSGRGPVTEVLVRTVLVLLILLVVLAPLLGEGVICILMASPIVIAAVLLVALLHYRWRPKNKTMSAFALAPFLYSALFYPQPEDLPRHEARFETEFAVPPDFVWKTFTEDFYLSLGEDLPMFLKMGFPKPIAILGSGENIGDKRRVVFDTGEILAEVVEAVPNKKMRLKLSTHRSHGEFFDRWVFLDEMTVELEELPGGRTRYRHVAAYRNRLFPVLYFQPIERYSAMRVEKYLAEQFGRYLLSRR